jgi:hypothetical protein
MTLPTAAVEPLVSALKRDADTNHPQVGTRIVVHSNPEALLLLCVDQANHSRTLLLLWVGLPVSLQTLHLLRCYISAFSVGTTL